MNILAKKNIEQFKQWKILVIGDLILDHYVEGKTQRLCAEGPIPVVDVTKCSYTLGGSANVALNFAALGAQVTYCSVAGEDAAALTAIKMMGDHRIQVKILKDAQRNTIVKTRIMAEKQLLARYDAGTTYPVSDKTNEWLESVLKQEFLLHDAVIISDYDKGVVTEKMISILKQLQDKYVKYLAVDAKKLQRFNILAPSFVKPNYKEAVQLLNTSPQTTGRIKQMTASGKKLYEITNATIIALTADMNGSVIVKNGTQIGYCVPHYLEHPNVVGAGDVFFSAFVLSALSGFPEQEAADMATNAAVVGMMKTGCTCSCTMQELSAFLSLHTKYIADREQVASLGSVYRSMGKKVVFTNGCFDILHRGHISFLSQARALGDVLIVGLNYDESVRRQKGAHRPINPLADRKTVLTALECVTHIIPFGSAQNDTATEIIALLRPDVYVKGGNYSEKELPEAELMQQIGGSVAMLPLTPGWSTSGVIHKINPSLALKTVS
ncbi:PfkB family carbohydrate kinase [Niabella aquatica]